MVEGRSIDITRVDSIIAESDLIVSHNASFDRAFLDKISQASQTSVWACTLADIDWLERGFPNGKQELLCHWHGFYFDAHRAMSDVDALIHLVTHPHYLENRPLSELASNAWKPVYVIKATNFPYDPIKKDTVKANGYKWNNDERIWYKRVLLEDLEDEKTWLTGVIYEAHFNGIVEEINLIDKYK